MWGNPEVMVKSESESHSDVTNSLWPHGLYSPWNSPGQNTEVRSLSLLQGIFPTQGSHLGLLHLRQILYHLSYLGSPSSEQMGELWQVSHQQLIGWFRVLLANNTWFHWPTLDFIGQHLISLANTGPLALLSQEDPEFLLLWAPDGGELLL